MYSNLDLLCGLLQKYQKFVLYDAAISIVKCRNYAHISMLYRGIISKYVASLKNVEELDKEIMTSAVYSSSLKIFDEILEHYLKITDMEKTKNNIQLNCLHNQVVTIDKNSVRYVLYTSKELVQTVLEFIEVYRRLSSYTNAIIPTALFEFHQALTHLIIAMVSITKNNKNDDELLEIAEDNISKAISHLKHGIKDMYRIIIKISYQISIKYRCLPGSFNTKFAGVMCDDIFNISEESNIDSSKALRSFALYMLESLRIDVNIDIKDEFTRQLSDYIL